jgi:hypothetical protein
MFTGTFAHAQHLYQLNWGEVFNNSAGSDTEDNWVANSYTVSAADRTRILSISAPIGLTTTDIYTNQPISALIYLGFDVYDPTANGGLVLMHRTDTTFTTTNPGEVVTVTLDTPVDFNVGDIMYAALLVPGVPGTSFLWCDDIGTGSGLGGLLQTQPLQRSFFDVGLAMSAPWDPSQGSANITVLGGIHPVVGIAQDAGNLALWVNATATPMP